MSDDGAPKSAIELAMERLEKRDKDEGIEQQTLSDTQREEIAEIRRVYDARLAEREILHRSAVSKGLGDPEAAEALEIEYRRDRERLQSERDRKIEKARAGG